MQRLRSTFKRSRTPTGNEMKSQSSLEVPKQVRSASFDEIQLEAQRQESSSSLSSSSATNAELRSIASIAMATSGGLAVSSALSSSSSSATAAAAASSSSSSSWSNQYQGWGQQQQQPPPPSSPTPTMTSSGRTSQSPLPSWSEHFAQLHGAGASAAAAASASTGTLLRRSANTLRPPPGGGQRSKSFDVASVGEHRHHHGHGSHGQGPSLLDRSASTTSSIAIDRAGGGSSPSHTGYGYSRWKSSAERDNPPAQAYSCWHCACVDEYRASLQQKTHLTVGDSSASTWGDTDEPDNYSYDDDYYDNDADEECDSFSGGGIGSSGELADFEPGPLQLERDASDNSYYFVVVRKAYEDSCLGSADDGSELGLEAGETSGGRREGSPEIRVTLTPSTSLPESEPGAGGCGFESEEAIGGGGGGGAFDLGPATSSGGSSAASRQRRRSLSRQEALELPILLQVAAAESSGPGDSSPDEDEQQASPREISTTPTTTTTTTTTDQDDGCSGGTPRERAASAENPAAGLVVRDIFLTVPDLKRDRAASVDSCFNNNKNGKIETCYSLQVPQQSPRSKSVDIVLPTDVQTRYTALLPEDARFLGEKDDGGAGAGQRELRSTPDWSSTSLNGEHLWVPTAASGEFCYINDCSKHGARLKCSACRVVVHTACTSSLNFACKPSFRDVGVRQYREQKVTQHHWVHRRSQKGKCTNCAKSFQSKLSFSSKEIVAVGCSWCKQAYHNRESCFNAERIGEECRLGLHSSIMVPPSWIVKLPKRGAFKSSLRKSPKKKRGPKSKDGPKGEEEEKEDPLKLWVVKPIPTSSVTPVLVFINPRSGGNQGAKLLQKFQWLLNPRQVFDLTQGGPKMGLELFKKVPNLRILACGGDGTVGWVLSVLDQIGANPAPAVGTLPLGTGNDLARALGWGGGYTDEPIGKILVSMAESEISILDRWQLLVERNPDASGQDEDAAKGKENLPLNVVNNYFSLGVDAHIALEFHEAREAHPERFNSRLRNKMFYGQMGGKDLVVRRWKDLSEYVTLECDGQDVTAKLKEHRVHAILFLNIDSYGGGTHPWGGGMGRPPTTEDGLIEVVGLTTYQLPLLQAGGHGTSIAQCSTAKLVTSKTIPMQVDGEACRLLPSIINMNLLNKATMLAKRRNQGKPRQKAAEVERLKLPLMKIRMHDYETFHSDKERLIKTAQTWQSEPLELDAGMDLESLRNQLSKTLPMDNCCFLDSCTAERFFRIDRAQEQLHYVADVVSEAIYILQEGPAGSSSSQAANNSSSQQQSQQSHGDNANMSREERRKMPSGERKSRGSDTNRHQSDNNNYDGGGGGSYSARSRQGSSNQAGGGSRGSLTADQQREERRRPGASEGAYYDGPSKLSSNKSHHSQSSHHFVQHTPGSAYISPRDRLFGLSSEVHTFSHELLERTSDGILKVAKSGDIVGLKDLHQRGYSLLSIDAQGQTALHLASAAGHKDVVRYLIACAPPIILNMVDNDKGQTALHKAAQQKKRSICCMLVAGGARLTVRDLAGNTPRELALAAEDHELAAYLQSQEQFQLMTEEGGYMS